MKKIFLFLLIVSLAACGTVQTGAVSRAYEKYESKDYERALELISFAQKVDDLPPELNAELTYLKAQTFEQMGMKEKSDNLLLHLAEQYRNTEYGSLVNKKLNSTATD